MSLLLGVNILGSATMAFTSPMSSSGGVSPTSTVDGLQPAALNDFREDQTGIETLVASLRGGSSKNASLSKLHSLTGGTNRSLFFTESSAHNISPELLKTAAISLLNIVPCLLLVLMFSV